MKKIAQIALAVTGIFSLCGKDIDLEPHIRKYWKIWQNKKIEVAKPKYTPDGNPGEMTAYLEACLKRFAPHFLDEYAAIDRILNLPEKTYLGIMASGAKVSPLAKVDHECTSWVMMPDATGGRQLLMHKNRDSKGRPLTLQRRAVPGKHAWIGNGSVVAFAPTQGMNDCGLVVMMNSGCPVVKSEHSYQGIGTTIIARTLLEECANAKDAVALLTKIINDRADYHWDSGSIWFIGDSKDVFIVENTTYHAEAKRVNSGVIVRANAFHYPEMQKFSIRGNDSRIAHHRRENAVAELLITKALRPNGVITPLDSMAASRISVIPEDKECYPPCGKNTISATTFAVDLEYPDVLSTAYMVFASPASSCYLPVPVMVTDIPDELLNGDYSERAFVRAENGLPFLPEKELKALEMKLYKRHTFAIEAARKLLKNGGSRMEAAGILQQAFNENWKDIINSEK